jgi:hypothetical protein
MEKYPALCCNRAANLHNSVRAELIRGNLWVVRRDGTTEDGPYWRESRRQFVVIKDALAYDVPREGMQHRREEWVITLGLDSVRATGGKQRGKEIE